MLKAVTAGRVRQARHTGLLLVVLGIAGVVAACEAASQPKQIRWYEAGHFLNCTARADMMAWLARHIRMTPHDPGARPDSGTRPAIHAVSDAP